MPNKPERARALFPRVDPARLWGGWPLGLRDGAVLALLSAGLSAEEVVELRASAVTSHRDKLWVKLRHYGNTWFVVLSPDLGGPWAAGASSVSPAIPRRRRMKAEPT